MKINTLGWLLAVTALASATTIVACSQAAVQCQAGHTGLGLAPVDLGFTTRYYPVGTPGAACVLPGDLIGFETYHPPGGGEDGTQPDFSVPSGVAFKTNALGDLIAAMADKGSVDPEGTNHENDDGTHVLAKHPAYSLGKFSTIEPVDDFCKVDAPAPAVQEFPRVAASGMDPEVPAMSVKYEWTDVKVYVTASAQGTQFSGHLKYTEDACVAEYNVAGVWPTVPCGVDKDVDDGMGGTKTISVPEDSLCCPSADPLGGRIVGSGINPDFPVKCDPNLLRCVLDTEDPTKLPVLKPGWDGSAPQCKLTTDEPAK